MTDHIDGIPFHPPGRRAGSYRPLYEFKDCQELSNGFNPMWQSPWHMQHDLRPTEEALDCWVATGHLR